MYCIEEQYLLLWRVLPESRFSWILKKKKRKKNTCFVSLNTERIWVLHVCKMKNKLLNFKNCAWGARGNGSIMPWALEQCVPGHTCNPTREVEKEPQGFTGCPIFWICKLQIDWRHPVYTHWAWVWADRERMKIKKSCFKNFCVFT